MKILNIYLRLLFVLVLVLPSCENKTDENDGWVFCYDCDVGSWEGSYSGTAEYFESNGLTSEDGLEVNITFQETGTNYLTVSLHVPNYYSTTVSGELNSPYSISFAGSGSSITASLYTKENELRITGNSKKFHYKVDSLIVDEVVSFEALKITKK